MSLEQYRDETGKLPKYAWPGGYPIFYLTRDSMCVCPDCANRETDQAQEPVATDINWEDGSLSCDDCGRRIESAYAEEEEV
jgi:hypothetical protein